MRAASRIQRALPGNSRLPPPRVCAPSLALEERLLYQTPENRLISAEALEHAVVEGRHVEKRAACPGWGGEPELRSALRRLISVCLIDVMVERAKLASFVSSFGVARGTRTRASGTGGTDHGSWHPLELPARLQFAIMLTGAAPNARIILSIRSAA